MSRPISPIQRLKLVASCGNLIEISSKINLSTKSINDNSKSNRVLNRKSMIDAPARITHRRMFSQYRSTRPPWAVDNSINPFDRDSALEKPKRMYFDQGVQTLVTPELLFYKIESPPLSIDTVIDDANNPSNADQNDYRAEFENLATPRKTTVSEGIQADLSDEEFSHQCSMPRLNRKVIDKQNASNQGKRQIMPLKEMKRNNQKNNLTYRISNKNSASKGPIDSIFDDNTAFDYRSQEEIQARIDYWLKKSLGLQDNYSQSVNNIDSLDSNKHQFRNHLIFTTGKTKYCEENQRSNLKLPSGFHSPQPIDSENINSESESEKKNIISSRRQESLSPKLGSHCTIQDNLDRRTESQIRNEELANKIFNGDSSCDVCGKHFQSANQINFSGIVCHKECFICFWCQRKLRLENYKINSDKLCCPLHFRLLAK